jgi:hypothetical protein
MWQLKFNSESIHSFPYDMFVKHLAFYMSDVIEVGVEIVPMKSLQSQMSSGTGIL